MKPQTLALLTLPLLVSWAVLLSACGPADAPSPAVGPSLPAPMPVMATNQDSWILVDLPPDATQLQRGAEIYRLVCSACHAHSGEGLTDAWRATWGKQDQNCWQSKCHAANHPPDGFVLPIAPAVVGTAALAPFETAADLRAYIQSTMPWQEPNSMTEEEGWAVTAYVVQLNRLNPGPELNAENGAQLRLHPESVQPIPAPTAESSAATAAFGFMEPARILGAAALVAVAVFLAVRVTRREKTARKR